jgi:hypothetical protein
VPFGVPAEDGAYPARGEQPVAGGGIESYADRYGPEEPGAASRFGYDFDREMPTDEASFDDIPVQETGRRRRRGRRK